jgi:hypothetical protein
MNDFTAPRRELISLRGERGTHSPEGIQPIAKSTSVSEGSGESFLREEAQKPLGVFDVVEDQKDEKWNLLCAQHLHKSSQGVSCQTEKILEAHRGSKKSDFGGSLTRESVFVLWGYEWLLPGHGEPYGDCGSWRSKGCLNVEEHNQDGLYEDMAGKVFVRRFRRTCLRAQCPTCYESWAGKEAGKIEYRLRSAPRKRRAIHLIVSPSVKDIAILSYEGLRAKSYVISKKSGFLGGSCIFHPFRENESTKQWYFSPHFHMIGFGWIEHTKEGYEEHGWVVKNAGLRKTVSGTALYQLSHAGIHDKHHTITWFGSLSYNKLHIPPKKKEEELCPLCGEKIHDLWYFGSEQLPEEEGDFWLAPEGWMYKLRRFDGG